MFKQMFIISSSTYGLLTELMADQVWYVLEKSKPANIFPHHLQELWWSRHSKSYYVFLCYTSNIT